MVLNRQHRVRVPVPPLERFLAGVLRHFRLPADSVTVCLAADTEVACWNRQYRGKRGSTDVLSFPANGHGAASRNTATATATGAAKVDRNHAVKLARGEYLGDIAISPHVARRNATRFGRSLALELRILILHGVLHLLGYDHETDEGEMERYEHELRAHFRLA
jgi:probable rRNA maturation factor